MWKVLVIVPTPLDAAGTFKREQQSREFRSPDLVEFVYRPVRVGPDLFDSYHDFLLADFGIFELGSSAEDEGFDAVCIDTMSDSGVDALRSVLSVPVIGPARASYLTALMLGDRFSVLTQWGPWEASYRRTLRSYGLMDRCASIRSTDIEPDLHNLLENKEHVFEQFLSESYRCIDDGADVICLGSTTMHEAGSYLAQRLPVPVINPGPLTYALVVAFLSLGLTQSSVAYQTPASLKLDLVRSMVNGVEG